MTNDNGLWCKPVLMCLAILCTVPVIAQAADDLDVTMRMVVEDEDLTNSVVREIELPEPMLPGQAESRGAPDMPERPDIETALDAMERGQDIGESASERANEAREVIESDRPGSDGILDSLPGDDSILDTPDSGDLLDESGDLLDEGGDLINTDDLEL